MTPIYRAIFASMKPTREWFNAVTQICRIAQQQIANDVKAAGQLSRYIAQVNNDISADIDASYKKTCDSEDKVFNAIDETVRGVDTYKGADGEVDEVPIGYDHYYKNDAGDIVATSDPHFDPNPGGFREMDHIDLLAQPGQ